MLNAPCKALTQLPRLEGITRVSGRRQRQGLAEIGWVMGGSTLKYRLGVLPGFEATRQLIFQYEILFHCTQEQLTR